MTDLKRRLLEEAVGKPVSRETFDRLLDYEDLFRTWSARINLASQSTLATFWNRHVVDSAQLVRLAPDAKRWVDLGMQFLVTNTDANMIYQAAANDVATIRAFRKDA